MSFSSDTCAPAHPAVLAAQAAANTGFAPSYGADDYSARLAGRLREVFETDDLAVAIATTGTAANALALSMLTPPTGGGLCHHIAHINTHERGAPEFFTGAKLTGLPGDHARIDPDALEAALAARDPGFVHLPLASALSISNLTESGTVYSPAEASRLCGMAKDSGLGVHVDGARLANAIAATGAAPADLTWRAGADAVSFGLTKNGGMSAEMMILFGPLAARGDELEARRKRAGQMPAKARFAAAEALALLEDGLWLDLAAAANRAATKLSEGLAAIPGVEVLYPVQGNLVFVQMPEAVAGKAAAAGAGSYARQGSARLVCSWNTEDAEIEALLSALA